MMLRSPDWRRIPVSDDDELVHHEGDADEHNDGRSSKASSWLRVKWTDDMVRLLITTVSYLVESEVGAGAKRKLVVLQKRGKWRLVSKVMADRAFRVSPQQCEDKFNDLNKRYKKLNDMLGRGTSCRVVENPSLLDSINFLSEKEKDDVRKILSSKHLFYEEMCSYHNGNRLHLPHDPELQHLLQLAHRSGDDLVDVEDDDPEIGTDDCDEYEEPQAREMLQGLTKRSNLGSAPQQQIDGGGADQISAESGKASMSHNQWIEHRTVKLLEQKLQIQVEMMELERQCSEWQKVHSRRFQELEKMRMENDRMKIENSRMVLELELKHKEMLSDF